MKSNFRNRLRKAGRNTFAFVTATALTLTLMPAFGALDADIFAVQEIKMQSGEAILDLAGYRQFWNHGEGKG